MRLEYFFFQTIISCLIHWLIIALLFFWELKMSLQNVLLNDVIFFSFFFFVRLKGSFFFLSLFLSSLSRFGDLVNIPAVYLLPRAFFYYYYFFFICHEKTKKKSVMKRQPLLHLITYKTFQTPQQIPRRMNFRCWAGQ